MSKKDQEKSSFPTMGESIPQGLINISGNRSPYTTATPRKTQGRGSSPTGKAAVRGRTMIHEANGPSFHVSTTLYKQNAAEASATQRNTRILPPCIHREDGTGSAGTFWDKREFGQRT